MFYWVSNNMHLKLFEERTKCVEFNGDLTLLGQGVNLEDRKTCGFLHLGNGGPAAIYANPKTILLSINNQIWDLFDADTDIVYFHSYKSKTTLFRVSKEVAKFEFRYPSWWAERPDFTPSEQELVTEEDYNEDFFGYVASIKDNAKMAKNLHELWRKNLDG